MAQGILCILSTFGDIWELGVSVALLVGVRIEVLKIWEELTVFDSSCLCFLWWAE